MFIYTWNEYDNFKNDIIKHNKAKMYNNDKKYLGMLNNIILIELTKIEQIVYPNNIIDAYNNMMEGKEFDLCEENYV